MVKFFQLIPSQTNIKFIDKFPFFLGFSVISLIFVGVGIFWKGLNYGVDFTGGTVLQIKFPTTKSIEEVRQLISHVGEPTASVVALDGGAEFLITSRLPVEKGAMGELARKLKERATELEVLSQDIVGPKVGSELKASAMRSLFYTILLIMIYIWFRFEFKFAPGATLAMLHDLAMMVGFYLLTGREFNITAIAALLTIAGYSVNDTIVIYDRVRAMVGIAGKVDLSETINRAINLTLSRTLLTSFLTLLSVIPLIVFGKNEIKDFAMAMSFGVIVGTYSTIYIASPMTIYIDRWLAKRTNSTLGKPRTALTT